MTVSSSLPHTHVAMAMGIDDACVASTSEIYNTFVSNSTNKRVHRVTEGVELNGPKGDDHDLCRDGFNRLFPSSRRISVPLVVASNPHSPSSPISPRTISTLGLGHTDPSPSSASGAGCGIYQTQLSPKTVTGQQTQQPRRSSLSLINSRRSLNYPLPLSESEHLRAVAVMQERQESWSRVAAQSSSSASVASSPGSSAHSPLNRLTPVQSNPPVPSIASGSGIKLERKSSTNIGASGVGSGVGGVKGKTRKKVAKACLTCQKSHLTCDEKRPCTRCVKKGIGETCVEGVRKKAKYLLEGDERTTAGSQPPEGSPVKSLSTNTQNIPLPPPLHSQTIPHLPQSHITQTTPGQSSFANLPSLLPDTDTNLLPTRVSDDVWLSAPLEATEPEGLDERQIWGDSLGVGSELNGNTRGNVQSGIRNGTNEMTGVQGDVPSGGVYSFGPTAAADEFHMFDAMFGNMSPVFPFDTTPTSGNNVDDPFGLNILSNTSNGNHTRNDSFSGWTNDFTAGTESNTNAFGSGQNGFGGGSEGTLLSAQTASSNPSGQPSTNNTNPNNPFDLNAAWTAWTNGGNNGSFAAAAANAQTQSQNQIQSQGFSNNNSNVNDATLVNQATSSTGVSPMSNLNVPQLHNSRSSSAPVGTIPTSINQSTTIAQPVQNSRIHQTQPQQLGQVGPNIEVSHPIGSSAFANIHQGNNGFRSSRTTPSEVYRTVVKPYDYTEGYHVLMQYLTQNFEQRDVLKVVHALAAYRPSLIALQMPMSEEDEIFIERSFQRTLIELEKLISYSATPTAVWRRTGEVCYANPEFCRLVGRTESDLCSKKSYIYHIFAQSSVISYWENFSVHAFENTTQNFFQSTSLQQSTDEVVQCSACFTIRRDVFDLPSVIIGQFLPIPLDLL